MTHASMPTLNRRHVVQSLATLMLLPPAYSANAQIRLATAINRMARFRALSQRIAKGYTQLHLGVLPSSAKDIVATAQHLVQMGLEDLTKGQFNTEISNQITNVQVQASALERLTTRTPSKDTVTAVAAQADKMLNAANAATRAIEGQSSQGSAKLINVAGGQRYLSQRMAKNYFLAATGLGSTTSRNLLQSDRAEFNQGLTTLGNAPISTPGIRNELALAQAQWIFFDSAINRQPDTSGLSDVATTSERLLGAMNNLTDMYEDALKSVLG